MGLHPPDLLKPFSMAELFLGDHTSLPYSDEKDDEINGFLFN
jgi:hypothetical protein